MTLQHKVLPETGKGIQRKLLIILNSAPSKTNYTTEAGHLSENPEIVQAWLKVAMLIYKKYVFGHSDEQNLFLIYIWSSSMSTVPGSQLPKPRKFPDQEEQWEHLLSYYLVSVLSS